MDKKYLEDIRKAKADWEKRLAISPLELIPEDDASREVTLIRSLTDREQSRVNLAVIDTHDGRAGEAARARLIASFFSRATRSALRSRWNILRSWLQIAGAYWWWMKPMPILLTRTPLICTNKDSGFISRHFVHFNMP